MKKLLLAIYLLIFSFGYAMAQKKAVFIILDGIPADVIESVYTPTLDEIAADGGYTRAYTGGLVGDYSETPTISAVGYNSLITGTWANKHNVWGNDIKDPNYNYWNIFRIVKTANPNLKTAIFSTWLDNRTKLIGEGLEEAGSITMDYAFDGFELDSVNFPHTEDRTYIFNIDEHISKEAGKYILEEGPDLSWVYLEFTDDIGHLYGDSPKMEEAVMTADNQVKRIWESIKFRKEEYGEDWMILITTDHGRDKKNGKGHGGQTERERTIWICTDSNDLNKSFYNMPSMVDIMPSLLAHMKIEIPDHVKKEVDGVSFLGPVKAKNLRAEIKNSKLHLNWEVYSKDSIARFYLASTKEYGDGRQDDYIEIGECSLQNGSCELAIPQSLGNLNKIVMEIKGTYLNTWLIVD